METKAQELRGENTFTVPKGLMQTLSAFVKVAAGKSVDERSNRIKSTSAVLN